MRGIRADDAAVGLLVAVLGLIGLIQAAGATDNEIYVFGLSLPRSRWCSISAC